MSAALLVLPDFLIIIFGWLLNRKFGFSREFFVSALVAIKALTLVFIFDIFSPNKKWLTATA